MPHTRSGSLALGLWFLLSAAGDAADWPQWGGKVGRNPVSSEVGLPDHFTPGRKKSDGSGIDPSTTMNVRWTAKLGSETYTSPVVANGRVYIATNDQSLHDPRIEPGGGGLLMCLDERSGAVLWRLPTPRLARADRWRKFRKYSGLKWDLGICSTPTVEDERLYLVSNRGEAMCLDVRGLSNGNDGPCQDEGQYIVEPGKPAVRLGPTDADIVWRFDMLSELDVFPHDANCSAPLICGDAVYVGTANGVGDDGTPCPQCPSLIALDKRTGKLVGFDATRIGERTYHGQWSSPSTGQVAGRSLLFYGGGDGWCYAFEPLAGLPAQPAVLKCVWRCDCNPPEYRLRNGKAIEYWKGDANYEDAPNDNANDGSYVGPSEIIAPPVFAQGRVYATIGRDPEHGNGRGALTCIDATGSGDISRTGVVWRYAGLQRSLAAAAVADGLVYAGDIAGTVHCLDAQTGRPLWTYPTKQEAWSSILVADKKVYFGGKKTLTVLAAGSQPKLLAEMRLGAAVLCPAAAANGALYVASQRYLWAVAEMGVDLLTAPSSAAGESRASAAK